MEIPVKALTVTNVLGVCIGHRIVDIVRTHMGAVRLERERPHEDGAHMTELPVGARNRLPERLVR